MDPRLKPVLGFLAFAVGSAFAYTAGSVALTGTGVAPPTGPGVVRGTVVRGEVTRESPVGAPFLYGLVRLGGAGGGAGVDQSWSKIDGSAAVTVATDAGEVDIELPRPDRWRGAARFEDAEVTSLGGLPIISDATDVDERLRPPFRLRVKALRAGDTVVFAPGDAGAEGELWVGDEATIAADLTAKEQGRWPVVGLMAVMALVSFVLAFRTLQPGRG
ncbi:MAG: hypothetical protein AAF447_02450 [Myxococcota bacterium]